MKKVNQLNIPSIIRKEREKENVADIYFYFYSSNAIDFITVEFEVI